MAEKLPAGSKHIIGVMLESHLQPGASKFIPGKDDPSRLEYGKSITDACLGWDETVEVLKVLSDAVR